MSQWRMLVITPAQRSDQDKLNTLNFTEQKNTDTVSLLCSVTGCLHTVKWLHEGSYTTERKTSGPICSARATFRTSDFNQKSKDDSLKCEVRHAGEVHLFPFSPPQSSATTTPSTRKTPVKKRETEETNRPASENNNDGTKTGGWWLWLIGVFVAAAALLIISVAVLRWKRTKENKTQTDDNMARVDDEGEGDEDDAVTYSTLQASSSAAAADPSNLYATVN
ncbi:uncharacterized protein LOC131990730 [Centropristis striata]|uniref:uncharacterized protein LOC131990730 n=1 Tax=Centropristis striata TaxID=184440 RepID=UPI0027DFBAF8|nr:uncharacterized protein LOC131990730 [Centropristis striata]